HSAGARADRRSGRIATLRRSEMFKQVIVALGVAAGFAGCNTGPSPVAFCSQFETEVCARVFDCSDAATQATADFQTAWGTSPDDCTAKLKAQSCASVTNDNPCATSAMTYHGDQADACVSDMKAESCTAIMNGTVPEH